MDVTVAGCHSRWMSQQLDVTVRGCQQLDVTVAACHYMDATVAGCHISWVSQ